MTRIGLVARQDCGGLAAQSQEFVKALDIAATLVVDLGDKGRGPSFNFDWPVAHHVNGPNIDNLEYVNLFLDRVDVVVSIETFYGAAVIDLARRRNIPTVRYANPELYKDEGQDIIVLPTEWERDRIPGSIVIPQGVSKQKAQIVDRPLKNILHIAAPAMMDRNGTGDLCAALAHTNHSFNVTVLSQQSITYYQSDRHNWTTISDFSEDRFAIYKDVDALVVPRRYGGLSLVMLEAASFGIPVITTDLSPQNEWFDPEALLRVHNPLLANMVGGRFNVWNCDLESFTQRLDHFASHSLEPLSRHALSFANRNSWENISPLWHELFDKICP